LQLDLSALTDNTYITPTGEAVEDTALSALVHELGHALTGREDDINETDYKGANVTFVNTIYAELGIPEQVSYIAYDTTGNVLTRGFEYTNGAAIDRAFCEGVDPETLELTTDWDSSPAGNSRDLLIGGPSANTLKSGAGDDFLYGGLGADVLYGDADNDVLYGENGNDTLYGGPGDIDKLDGGEGDDTYWGGSGKDVYGPIIGNDKIMDFVMGEDELTLALDGSTYWALGGDLPDNVWEVRRDADDSLVGTLTFVEGGISVPGGAKMGNAGEPTPPSPSDAELSFADLPPPPSALPDVPFPPLPDFEPVGPAVPQPSDDMLIA
jgi:Ca2+-binding RTX toxin-like protein